MVLRYFMNFCKPPFYNSATRLYHGRVDQNWKRGSMLNKMLVNKDKKKNWQFEIMQNNIRSKNVFEKISRPSKRQNVLNSLFIKNITDVLSTGEIAPEVLGLNIEITGVKISPCCKILNVYWQIPPHNFSSHENIATVLNLKAPRIRAELISRNVLGRVPQIFFLRDVTNAYLAAFEEALKKADMGPLDQVSVLPNDTFTEDMFLFKDSKPEMEPKPKTTELSPTKVPTLPVRPADMRTDVFGLKHELLMEGIITSKQKTRSSVPTNVIVSPEWNDYKEDLFSKIPGTPLQPDLEREKLLKQFHVERKMMKKTPRERLETVMHSDDYTQNDHDVEDAAGDEDFIEEETNERL